MKRYTLRAAIHDARVFYRLHLGCRRINENRRKDPTLAGSHDRSDNQSRLAKAAPGVVLHNNIAKPNENHDNKRIQLSA